MHFQLWRWGNMRNRAKAGKCGWETCSNTCGGTTFSIRHYTNASQVRNLKRALQVPLHLYILTVLLLPHLKSATHFACCSGALGMLCNSAAGPTPGHPETLEPKPYKTPNPKRKTQAPDPKPPKLQRNPGVPPGAFPAAPLLRPWLPPPGAWPGLK